MKTKFLSSFLLIAVFANAHTQGKAPDYLEVRPVVFSLSMVMMHDVVNPPAASRYYAYAMAGAYEIIAQHDKKIVPLNKIIKSYPSFTIHAKRGSYDFRIAAVYCILETGKQMLPSGYMLEEDQKKYIENLKKNGINEKEINDAIAVAEDIAAQVVDWSKTDDYFKLSAKVRYTPLKGDAYWYPTPPGYLEAVEPNWKTVRPMIIDSAAQFKPLPPVAFSKDSTSHFYKLAKEVYDASLNLNEQQRTVAGFWDCNPFAIESSGHMMIGFKKMSPGGHWMNITGIACKTAKLSFEQSVAAHLVVAVTLMDAFISCWDEKYRSNRIRPETYINRYIDRKWIPLLQTPPFPEYTSGHSVISGAAAEVLTYIFGDGFTFVDDSEVLFDLAPRTFYSFRKAADEAAISRLYGGIHYMDAITNGVSQGKNVGEFIVSKLREAAIMK
ncbi:MAG: vanadium-dependent haloperoxidase [Agriterribacter sp.]